MIFTSVSLSFRDIPRNYIESFSISVSGRKNLQSKTPMAQEKIGIANIVLFYTGSYLCITLISLCFTSICIIVVKIKVAKQLGNPRALDSSLCSYNFQVKCT